MDAAEIPPRLEERSHLRDQYRVSADLVRYHQIGVASGWIETDGQRTEATPDTAVRVTDPVGGTGWGNCQPIAAGPWPDLGLPDEPWM
ncbi:hypothetical protein [Nonomuraea endophytica]|uniref:hypothetical protein n=1 Tax=Nonomuraea endophytica TaxID=714136 RepID=UPI0037C8F07F